MVRKKEMMALPEEYWNVIENRIDGVLIRSKGDAMITLINDMQKLQKPGETLIKFAKMVTISEQQFLAMETELNQMRAQEDKLILPKWLTQDILTNIKKLFDIPDGAGENSALIAIDSIRTSMSLASNYTEARKKIMELKARIAELEKNT